MKTKRKAMPIFSQIHRGRIGTRYVDVPVAHDYAKCGTYDVFDKSLCPACPDKSAKAGDHEAAGGYPR